MAQRLSADRQSNHSELSQERFGYFMDRADAIDQDVADAVAERKVLRSVIKTEGGKEYLRAFDRARKDAYRSGAERVAEDEHHRRMMQWLGKPLGYQPGFDFGRPGAAAAPPPIELSIHELKRVDSAGFEAGKGGERADRNPWNPGTEPFARWHTAWLRGQAEAVGAAEPPPKRGRGRPKGSGKKQRETPAAEETARFEAHKAGYEDGMAGNRAREANWPSGVAGHGAYALGQQDAAVERGEMSPEPPLP